MTRSLAVVSAEPRAVLAALREALAGDGPAILPRAVSPRRATKLPAEVPRRVALVVETSGSTGVPKRVALGADALLASAAASESALGGPGQWLLALPAHYIAGVNVLVRSITSGTEPIILPGGHFDAEVFAEASDEMDAPLRFASLVPTQLLRLLDAAEQNLPVLDRLRRFDRLLIGGQSTPPGLVARALELGLNISRSYGSSETSGGCVYDGIALPGVEVRVVDGEVQIGGATLAEGYLGDAVFTEKNFLDDRGQRWYRTGDAGEVEAQLGAPPPDEGLMPDEGDLGDESLGGRSPLGGHGRRGHRTAVAGGARDRPTVSPGDAEAPGIRSTTILRVTGRLDSVIISGGMKVSLAAVERVAGALPGLSDAVAVSAPSVEWGEVPVVFTGATDATGATGADTGVDSPRLNELRSAVQDELGAAARPAALLELGRIPLLASGKPDRIALAAIARDRLLR